MRSTKWLLAALILTTVAACGNQQTASSPTHRIDERHMEVHRPSASSPTHNGS